MVHSVLGTAANMADVTQDFRPSLAGWKAHVGLDPRRVRLDLRE